MFHLHGRRTNPEEIIIAQEDYVTLFRPNEYRQIKLALTIKESTTLLLGYGLGDVNVLTALDWSKNVFKGEQQTFPNDVIQVLRLNNPSENPYRDNNGIVVVEAKDLSEFFDEFATVREEQLKLEEKTKADLNHIIAMLDNPNSSTIVQFIDKRNV